VVAGGREGVIALDVTLDAYNKDKFLKFIQTKVIPSLDTRRFIFIDNVPFYKSCGIQQTYEDVEHIYFHFASFDSFFNVTQ